MGIVEGHGVEVEYEQGLPGPGAARIIGAPFYAILMPGHLVDVGVLVLDASAWGVGAALMVMVARTGDSGMSARHPSGTLVHGCCGGCSGNERVREMKWFGFAPLVEIELGSEPEIVSPKKADNRR